MWTRSLRVTFVMHYSASVERNSSPKPYPVHSLALEDGPLNKLIDIIIILISALLHFLHCSVIYYLLVALIKKNVTQAVVRRWLKSRTSAHVHHVTDWRNKDRIRIES